MAKAKLDLKALLLKRGELLILGAAGLFLFIMLISGVSVMGSAKDPGQVSNELKQKANTVNQNIASKGPLGEAEVEALKQPDWLVKPNVFKTPHVPEFTQSGPLFESKFNKVIIEAARKFDVDAALVSAVIKAESDYEPRTVSNKARAASCS